MTVDKSFVTIGLTEEEAGHLTQFFKKAEKAGIEFPDDVLELWQFLGDLGI